MKVSTNASIEIALPRTNWALEDNTYLRLDYTAKGWSIVPNDKETLPHNRQNTEKDILMMDRWMMLLSTSIRMIANLIAMPLIRKIYGSGHSPASLRRVCMFDAVWKRR